MRSTLKLKLLVDMAMLGCLLAGLAYQFTGNLTHELLGLVFFGLCGVHTLVNRTWFLTIRHRKHSPRQRLNTVVNLLLVALMLFFLASGVFQSETLFPYFREAQTMETRKLHTSLAWWGFVLLGIHVGGHWNIIFAAVRQWFGRVARSRVATHIQLMGLPLLFAYGTFVFIERDVIHKLLGITSYDYWDFDTAAASYFFGYAALFSLCAGLTHYGLSLYKQR